MQVCLYLDRSRVFRWHLWLTEALAALPGVDLCCAFAAETRPLPRTCALLFELERLAYGIHGPNALDPVDGLIETAARVVDAKDAFWDVVVDLAGTGPPLPECARALRPCFNAIPGELGLIAALVRDQQLEVELHDTRSPQSSWTARPTTAEHGIFLRSLDGALSCTVGLAAKALKGCVGLEPSASHSACRKSAPQPLEVAWAAAVRASVAVTLGAVRRIEALAKGGSRWAIAWRFARSLSLLDERQAIFSVMSDDGRRYYADPFPFRYGGKIFVFVEEFPYATARGCISVIEIDENGCAGPPRVVLEESHHLSYPFVFEHEGVIWMMPESGQAHGLYLYRAEQFPHRWSRETCLIDDIEGYDATLLRSDDGLWLFVCQKLWHSSSWDVLSLFHAEELAGRWQPHQQNPVLFDASLSRPAGAFFRQNGYSLRPVQDCSRRYGDAIILCRVDQLNPTEFLQTTVGRIHCGPYGCHTYNRCKGFEVIDAFGPMSGVREVEAAFVEPVPGALVSAA